MKQIIKQAIYQMRIQPLLSAVIVIGTAMAICLVMVLMIVNQAKSAEVCAGSESFAYALCEVYTLFT